MFIDLPRGHGKSSWSGLTLKQLSGLEEPDPEAKARAVWTDIDNAFPDLWYRRMKWKTTFQLEFWRNYFKKRYDAIVYRSQFGQEGRDDTTLQSSDWKMPRFELCALSS